MIFTTLKYFIGFTLCMLCILSCDGRDRVHKSPKTILQENNLLKPFSKKDIYIPERYTEVIQDSLLSTGFHVSIRFYSDLNMGINKKNTTKLLNTNTHYREFIAEIQINKAQQNIFKQQITATFFNKNKLLGQPKSIIKNISVNTWESTKNKLIIDFWIENITLSTITKQSLIVNSTGTYYISSNS